MVKMDEWEAWSFSFKGSVRAQDTQAYSILTKLEQMVGNFDESASLNSEEDAISGQIYNLRA